MSTIYSKDSFDRFGDDLCEHLLSYLKFEEKFKYECLNKQWKRLVFNKQNKLFIGFEDTLELKTLETILTKCRNIGSIYVDNNCIDNREQVFELIVKYCEKLVEFESEFEGLSQRVIKEFFEKFGSDLKKICFHSSNESIEEELKLCSKLKVLNIKGFNDLSVILKQNELLVHKLKDISFVYSSDDSNRIEIFVEKNKNSLESVKVNVNEHNLIQNQLNPLFGSLSSLSKLKHLFIDCNSVIDNSVLKHLRDLSKNCRKLSKIELMLRTNSEELNSKVFQTIKCFKRLKRLHLELISISDENPLEITSEELNECENLTHFSFTYSGLRITDNFFENIAKHLPKLKHIYCSVTEVSDQTFHSLFNLSELQSIDLNSDYSDQVISETVILELIRNCAQILKINFENTRIYIELTEREIRKLRETDGQMSGIEIIKYKSESISSYSDYDLDFDF